MSSLKLQQEITNKALLKEVFLEIEEKSKMLNSFIKKVNNIN
jgi:hypothetical protein